jgi:molybdenum cofactor cytidylyltransferase
MIERAAQAARFIFVLQYRSGMSGIQGILLAAGSATRFGSDKLMHPLEDGAPIALASARNLIAALPQSLAVVRSAESALARLLRDAGLMIVACEDASEGMGRSLAAGVRASPRAAGWVVALADMPFIRPQTIRRVAGRLLEGDAIVAPFLGGARGHPVGFAASLRAQLESFRSDAGARSLLLEHEDRITRLDVDDPGVLRDIDTPQDLAG